MQVGGSLGWRTEHALSLICLIISVQAWWCDCWDVLCAVHSTATAWGRERRERLHGGQDDQPHEAWSLHWHCKGSSACFHSRQLVFYTCDYTIKHTKYVSYTLRFTLYKSWNVHVYILYLMLTNHVFTYNFKFSEVLYDI